MSTEIFGVITNDVGVPVLPVDNPAGEAAFYKMFLNETPAGKKLRPLLNDKINNRFLAIIGAKRATWRRDITLDDVSKIVEDLFITKDPVLFPTAPAPEFEAVDNRERNANGQFKSEFQIFSEQHSAFECNERAKVDATYRAWKRGQHGVEGLQEGAYRFAGAPLPEGTWDNPQRRMPREIVADFAKVYKAVPAERLRARGGRVTLDENHSYTVQDYELLVSQAAAVGLL